MERVVNQRIKVLIAEDLEDDALLIIEELRRGGYDAEYRRVETEEELSEALDGSAWSLVITDYSMPRFSAMEAIRVAGEKAPDLPVIIVSGVMGEDFAVDAMKAGAKDYLIKDRLSRLVPAVERVLREAEGTRARRRSEEEARHLNRLLRTVTEIDQAIVRQCDTDGLLRDACRILVEQGGFLMCWIGMADFESGRVVPVARAGFEGGYLEGLDVRLDDSPRAQGPTGTAIRTAHHVVCRNTEADERFRPWRKEAVKRGYRSSASFPLRVRGRVAGAVNVYSNDPVVFEEKTVNLLDRLADDIGYALQVIEESQKHALVVAALRESEERLRTIFESAMDGMFVIDMEGRYVDVNFAGCHMFGYTREEILSADASMLIFPEDKGKRLMEHRGYWKKGAFIPEVRMRKKDGAEIWVDLAITPFSVGDKELALGIKRDITERRLAEEALRESEERFRQIFEQNEDAQIILKHGTCEIIDANPAATTLYGFTREELVEGGGAHFDAGGRARKA